MTNLKLPSDDDGGKRPVSFARLSIWVIVGGIGAYLILSGLYGVITNGQVTMDRRSSRIIMTVTLLGVIAVIAVVTFLQ